MSTAPIITDLQKINPSAIIELFTLTTDATLHGSAQTYRFHNGTSLNANGDIIWAGNQYLKMPIEAEGFAFTKGQLPRPTLTVSNALGTITAILLNVNAVTTGNDLTGATVTRIRTLARYLDAINFPVTTTSTTTTTTIPLVKKYDELTLLHFDTHADLRESYQGEKFSHASAIKRCLDFKNVKVVSFGIRNLSFFK